MVKDDDPNGAAESATEYTGQKAPTSADRYGRSAWSVGAAAVVLIVALIAIFSVSLENPDPAPNGSPATGVLRQSGPAANKD